MNGVDWGGVAATERRVLVATGRGIVHRDEGHVEAKGDGVGEVRQDSGNGEEAEARQVRMA